MDEPALFAEAQERFKDRFEFEHIVAASPVRALFVARDAILKRRVALRIQLDPRGRNRVWFQRETELLAALDHRSIRAVFSAGYDGDWAYRVTKWVEGENLEQAVHRGPRSIPDTISLARDLLNVIEYAHSEHVVLRRIVPTTVMLARSGRAIITDLRFANRCLTVADPDLDPASEMFLAPETWHGHAGEPASDIYAVAALLYFAITGRRPANDPAAIVPPDTIRPTTPKAIQRVIMRGLAADPHDRYHNAADMQDDLLSELGSFPDSDSVPATVTPSDPVLWEKRLRRALGDEYELLDELGSGGFGSVYRVRDLRLEREVALKVLHPRLTADPAVVERFRREARLAAKLRHPNIVDVFDLGARNGLLWYTMAYVAGVSLHRVVQVQGPQPYRRVIEILEQALGALEHAHAHEVVHRDLKPENILVEAAGGAIRIADFGLAMALQADRFGGASSHSGTPEFAAPEQLLGESVDLRSDLYSLSIVAYFVIIGKSPFGGGTIETILARQTTGQLPHVAAYRNDFPRPVVDVLARGAARRPSGRFGSAAEYREALRRAVYRAGEKRWYQRLFTP